MAHLIVTTRNVYGNEVIDPVNEAAKAIASIAQTKTLRLSDIVTACTLLGCTIEVSSPVVTGTLHKHLCDLRR